MWRNLQGLGLNTEQKNSNRSDSMDKKQPPDFSSLKDLATFIGSVGKWGAPLLGGLCLLVYTQEIQHFPEGLTLGDGLVFYFISAGFLVTYVFYVAGITALGCLIMRLPVEGVRRLRQMWRARKKTKPMSSNPDFGAYTDFSPLWDPLVWGLGAAGLFFVWGLSRSQETPLAVYLAAVLVQGGFVVAFLVSKRRQRGYDSRILSPCDSEEGLTARTKSNTSMQRVIVGMIFFFPLLMGPDRLAFVDAGFRFAQLRKDGAVAHVKKPWSEPFRERGFKVERSFLGEDYAQFEKVTVLFHSVGDNVIVELPGTQGAPKKRVPIPTSQIYIE
jgi:hypothetical protein